MSGIPKRHYITVIISMILISISSLVIIVIPFGKQMEPTNKVIVMMYVASIFWLFLLIGYGCFVWTAQKLVKSEAIEKKPLWKRGFFRFFTSTEAKIIDCVMILSIVIFLILTILGNNNFIIHAINTVIFLITAQCHGIINGEIYIKTKENRREKDEKNKRTSI